MNKKNNIIIVSLIFSTVLWVSISLSNEYYASIKVNLKVIDLPYGYTTGSKLPSNIVIKLKGKGWKLAPKLSAGRFHPLPFNIVIKLKGKGWKLAAESLGADADFFVSAKYDSGKVNLNLYNSLSDNRWLANDVEVININPDTLCFRIERIASKKLKILPHMNLTLKQGYGLAEPVYIYPESTIVYGPWSVIKNFTSVTTEYVSYVNIDSR